MFRSTSSDAAATSWSAMRAFAASSCGWGSPWGAFAFEGGLGVGPGGRVASETGEDRRGSRSGGPGVGRGRSGDRGRGRCDERGAHGVRPAGSWSRRTWSRGRGDGSPHGPEEMRYSYRRSGFIRGSRPVVVAAEFRLTRDDPQAVTARMKEFAARRRRTQPLGMPSSGKCL